MKRFRKDINRGVDPLIRVIKKVYHSAEASADVTLEEIKKQRHFIERISHLVFRYTRISIDKIDIDNVEGEWIKPYYGIKDKKVILYCHGGGYTCGELGYAGILGTKLASYTGFSVLSFAYRLAPENRYPAALEDTIKVWEYLTETGFKPEQVIIAGDSAGGNLALELCLHIKKSGSRMPSALVLFSPWTDMTAEAPTYESEAANDPIISRLYVENARQAYLGRERTDYKNPDFSPVFADLTGFPPTLIQVGKSEVLRHDSEALARKLKTSGTEVKLQIYNGGWHVFQQFPTALARSAMFKVRDFLHMSFRNKQRENTKQNAKREKG